MTKNVVFSASSPDVVRRNVPPDHREEEELRGDSDDDLRFDASQQAVFAPSGGLNPWATTSSRGSFGEPGLRSRTSSRDSSPSEPLLGGANQVQLSSHLRKLIRSFRRSHIARQQSEEINELVTYAFVLFLCFFHDVVMQLIIRWRHPRQFSIHRVVLVRGNNLRY